MTSNRFFNILLVFIMCALFASVFTLEKVALNYTSPLFLFGSRMFLAGILMLGIQYFLNSEKFYIKKKDLYSFVVLAILFVFVTNFLELISIKYMSSHKTCLLYMLSPFISAIISYFYLSDTLSLRKFIGITFGFIGLIPLIIEQINNESIEDVSFAFLPIAPIACMLIAVTCSAFGWVQYKQLVHYRGYSSLMTNGVSMSIGGFIALIFSYFFEEWNPFPISDMTLFLKYSVGLIIVSNFICYNMYALLLRNFSANFMSFATNTIPLFSAYFGWFFLEEKITFAFWFSIVVMSFGLFLFLKEESVPSTNYNLNATKA